MKKLMVATLAVLLFGGLASAAEAKAPAKAIRHHRHHAVNPRVAEHHDWMHWGAAPYAHSFTEACRKTPKAIAMSRLPQEVKDLLMQKVGPGCRGGEDVYLTPTQHLDEMASASSTGDFMMGNVTVAKLPVLQGPDGLRYRANSVFETAHAKAWRVTFEGVTYVWFIPDVCYNDGWYTEVPKDHCNVIGTGLPAASDYPKGGPWLNWGVGSIDGEFSASGCNAQRDGLSGPWITWDGKCSCVEMSTYMAQDLGVRPDQVTIEEKHLILPKTRYFFLWFNDAVRTKDVYLCVYYPDGSTRTIVVRPQDWKGQDYIYIPNEKWLSQKGEFPNRADIQAAAQNTEPTTAPAAGQ